MRLAIDEVDEVNAGRDEDLLAREMRPLRQASAPESIAPGGPASGLLRDAWQDLTYAARMLRKSPGFAAAAVLTLALGIGANTAIFSLVNATLLQRLPVQNRGRLDYVFNGANWNILSYPAYAALRDGTRTLDGLAAWGGITASLNADGDTDLVSGVIVTGNFFDLLGLTAEKGRLLSTSDDVTPGAHPVAVISHRLWQTRFNGRPDILGSQVRLNAGVFTIVGVAPPDFPGPQLGVMRDVYVPMMMQALMRPPRAGFSGEMNPDLLKNPNNGWLFQLALRKPGVTPAQAQSDLVAVATTYARTSNPGARPPRLALVPLDNGDPTQRQQMRSVATLLGCVVGAVLLIACANVANLLLSKAAARRREVAIRLALGASRWRIVRQLLTESVLLATIGGTAGVLLAWMVVQSFQAAPPPAGALPVALEFAVDRRVLLFSLLLSVLTGLVFGAAPALQASSQGLVPALKDDAFVPDGRSRRFNLKKALVVSEVALSLLLLIAAGLFIRSLRVAQAIDPGFAVDEIVSAPLNVNILRYTKAQGREFYRRATERMEQIPGVTGASVARIALLTGGARVTTIAVEGRPDSGNRSQSEGGVSSTIAGQSALANIVGPGFFRTLGIPIVRGRDFNGEDTETRPRVAIVSETMARQFFPGEDAMGQRFVTASRARTVRGSKSSESRATASTRRSAKPCRRSSTCRSRSGMRPASRSTSARGFAGSAGRADPARDPGARAQSPGAEHPDDERDDRRSLYAPRMGAMLLTVFRRARAAPRVARHLWRARVLDLQAHAGDRDPDGARRGSAAGVFARDPRGHVAGRVRPRDRPRGRAVLRGID